MKFSQFFWICYFRKKLSTHHIDWIDDVEALAVDGDDDLSVLVDDQAGQALGGRLDLPWKVERVTMIDCKKLSLFLGLFLMTCCKFIAVWGGMQIVKLLVH